VRSCAITRCMYSTSGCEKYGKVVTSCQHLVNLFLFSSSFCSFYALHIVNMSIQLTPTKRQRIAFRYTETRDSRNRPTMVQIGKEFGVATSTVSKTLRRWREHGTTYTLDRSGRLTKMSPRDKRRAVAYMKSHPRSTWAEIADKFGVGVTKIRAVAHDAGLHKRVVRRTPFVSPQARKKRMLWSRLNPSTAWKRVVFTDESAIELGEDIGRRWTIRAAGDEYEPQNVDPTFHSSRQSLMVWGAIAYGKKWPLQRLPLAPSVASGGKRTKAEGLNGEKYAEWVIRGRLAGIVEEMSAVAPRDHRHGVEVVEDGAPSHKSKVAARARKEANIQSHFHPPSSPDLNPIEPIWRTHKLRVGQLRPWATTLDQPWAQTCQVWDEIDIETINRQVRSMPDRRKSVIKAKEWGTKW
jgi:transposase